MAERALLESFLSCHVCSETFRDPVSLSCSHSFCSSCLQNFWDQAKNKNCPICKRSSRDSLSVNLSLKELADSFAKRENHDSTETGKEKETEKEEVVCDKHPEVPYWFCEDEQRAVCPVCEFSLHQSHKVAPVEEAVTDLKQQLKSDLKTLKTKKNKCEQVEETYNEMIELSKKQLSSTETQIRAEFNKLHQFLKEEEESRLAALREEEEEKGKIMSREMKLIQEQISSLSDSISAVEEDLQKHKVAFLSSYKATQTRARAQCSLSDPQLVSGALIDVAKHRGNLSFRVWEKMKDKVHFSPVILDPNTASGGLHLSDELTSVRRGQKVKDEKDDMDQKVLSGEEVSKKLDRLFQDRSSNQRIIQWVEANLDEHQVTSNQFIRSLITSVSLSAIRDTVRRTVDTQQFQQRTSLLKKYVCDEQKQLQALYALQALMVRMDQPPNLLRMFFDILYDEDIIQEEAFYRWESSKDPAEQTGKGVALRSVTAFFVWLREADEE